MHTVMHHGKIGKQSKQPRGFPCVILYIHTCIHRIAVSLLQVILPRTRRQRIESTRWRQQ